MRLAETLVLSVRLRSHGHTPKIGWSLLKAAIVKKILLEPFQKKNDMSFSVSGNGQELLTFKIIHHGRLGTKLLLEGLGANTVEARLIYKQTIFSLRFDWIFGCPPRD